MRVNTKSGWFKLSVVLISIALVYVSCNFRPIFLNPKFTVWQPKQLKYTGELVQKWSFDLPSTGDVTGYVRKNGWKIEQNGNTYFVGSDGVKMDMLTKDTGFDDVNSNAREEWFLGSLSYFDNNWSIVSYWTKNYPIRISVAKDDFIIVSSEPIDDYIRKIDIKTGRTVWSQKIYSHLAPNFFIVGDKVAINTFHSVTYDDGRESGLEDMVYLLDIDDGEMEPVNVAGSTNCTVFNNELYLIIDDAKVSKYDIKKKSLVGKMFDITDYYKDGHYAMSSSLRWFVFENKDDDDKCFLLDPNTMELCVKKEKVCGTWEYLYNNYFLCHVHKKDRIVGIDIDSFKETWNISTRDFSKDYQVILGDERGVLIQDNDKLICFGPP